MPGRKSFAIVVFLSLAAVRLAADCPSTVVVQVPVTACKSGTATASVLGVPGASYAWTIDGGTIVGDATGDHIVITLGTAAKAVVSVTMTAAGCVSHGAGLITLRAPFDVHVAAIPAARANEPLTVSWSYDNGTPAQQTISGDFGTVSLPPTARSYSYTPQTSGNKQFVIDATLAGTAVVTGPATRQRAVSKSPVTSSICSAAHTAVPYMVDACADPPVIVDGPSSVVVGTSFQLAVRSQPGAVATWTIANGSPSSATGDSVTIMPASVGSVDITVELTRGACIGRLARSIAITPKLDCDNPKVSVSTGALSCGSVIVNATFTGTPPFHGKWSDGLPFNTDTMTLARAVAIPGNYSISEFQDAACSGAPSNIAIVPQFIPTATVYGFRGCTGIDSAYVQFTGKPPFSACWNDGGCFQTSQTNFSKLITAEGTNTLVSGTDATGCSLAITGSAQGILTPRVVLKHECSTLSGPPEATLWVTTTGSSPKGLESTWSDGVKVNFARGVSPSVTTTYTVTSVTSPNGCPVAFDSPQSYTFYPTPVPDITVPISSTCPGATGTVSVTPPPPGTQIQWSVSSGPLFGQQTSSVLVSGQGTSTVQYLVGANYSPDNYGSVYFSCTFTFSDPDRCPLTSGKGLTVNPVNPVPGSVNVSPSYFSAGKTADVTFSFGKDTASWSISNIPFNDPIAMSPCVVDPTTQITTCHGVYTSTHGPGNSQVTVHQTGRCGGTKDVSTIVQIVN
jgi:hypothetical protein